MRRVTLSTDRDLVVLSAVQWKFGGPGFYEYMVLWIPLLIFNDNDNSTASATAERLFEILRVYGSSTITTTATAKRGVFLKLYGSTVW